MRATQRLLARLPQRRWPVHAFIASWLLCFGMLSPAAVGLLRGQEAPHYLAAAQLDASALLPPPPRPGSDEANADMAQVVAVHRACTTNQAAVAFSEKKFSIFNFTPAIGEFFQPGKLPKTEQFFSRVQKEAAAATDDAKEIFKRPRPYTVDPSLASGKLEKSFSYPSGHSTEAMVLALLLVDLVPDKAEAILQIGNDIGWHRVLIARHYPTDIYAGRVFARAIVRELKSSSAFRCDFAEVQSEIATAQRAKEHQTAAPGS